MENIRRGKIVSTAGPGSQCLGHCNLFFGLENLIFEVANAGNVKFEVFLFSSSSLYVVLWRAHLSHFTTITSPFYFSNFQPLNQTILLRQTFRLDHGTRPPLYTSL